MDVNSVTLHIQWTAITIMLAVLQPLPIVDLYYVQTFVIGWISIISVHM